MTLKLRNGLKGTPTIFGWILHGGDRSIPIAGGAARAHAYAFRASIHEQLQNFWTLDHLGVTSDEVLERDHEMEVKNTFKRNETGKSVVSRLRRMVKRKTPEEYVAYDNQLKILLQEDDIEQLPRNCIPQA